MLTALLGGLATALNIVGNVMLARMSVWGWVVRLLTNVVFVLYAMRVQEGLPVIANHVIFFGINIYGFWRWRTQASGAS